MNDDYSTSKPSKILTVTGCRESDIMTCPPHTTGLGALVADLVVPQIDVRDGRICLQRLAQGLEAATDQGWHLVRFYRQNLITEIPRTINIQLRQCRVSLILNLKKQSRHPQFHSDHSAIFSICICWQLTRSDMNHKTTAPPNHPNFFLSKDAGKVTS